MKIRFRKSSWPHENWQRISTKVSEEFFCIVLSNIFLIWVVEFHSILALRKTIALSSLSVKFTYAKNIFGGLMPYLVSVGRAKIAFSMHSYRLATLLFYD